MTLDNSEKISFSRIIAGVMNWGSWGADLGTSQMSKLINQCVSHGVTTFDHADIYGGYSTEATFGTALQESQISRDTIQLITKCGICMPCDNRPDYKIKSYDTSKKHIITSVENSLRNLKTDYIDLLLIHRPSPLMVAKEIADAFSELKQSGKVKSFGVSNFNVIQTSLIHDTYPIVANQVEASLLHLDPFFDDSFDYCQKSNILPMIWSPLAGGKLFINQSDQKIEAQKARIQIVCDKYNWSIDEASYLFLLHHPYKLYPVTGSSKIERIVTAVNVLDKKISSSQWFELLEAARGQKVA